MSLEMTLLGLLHAKPATGYDLKKAMDASTEFLSPSPLSSITRSRNMRSLNTPLSSSRSFSAGR